MKNIGANIRNERALGRLTRPERPCKHDSEQDAEKEQRKPKRKKREVEEEKEKVNTRSKRWTARASRMMKRNSNPMPIRIQKQNSRVILSARDIIHVRFFKTPKVRFPCH
jgi:hypothetical protein